LDKFSNTEKTNPAINTKGHVLVTGGTGFLGAYIIKELIEKNYAVRAIKRITGKLPHFISPDILSKVEWVEGDILDVVSIDEAMQDVDAVIHSAAVVSFHRQDQKEMFAINVNGTANMVNLALENDIKRFVHISSVAAIGRTMGGGTVNENKKWTNNNVNTQYAVSKHKSEMEVWRGIGEGLNAVILNPSTILGYGDWNSSSAAIFKNVYNEFPWYTRGINGFVDVEDAAKATVLLMESEHKDERFIINGENWSFHNLFNCIADHFSKKHPQRVATTTLGEIAWRMEKLKSFFTGKKPLLTKESARLAHSKTFFENDKLLKTLPGFKFTALDVSIQKACNKYLKSLDNATV
jgi:dihydroflavonol-4-reductase